MVRRGSTLVVIALVGACQGERAERREPARDGGRVVPRDATIAANDAPGPMGSGVGSGSGAGAEPDEPAAAPTDLIAELGAMPAWQAVVDRAQYLERRRQQGVIWGRVGTPFLVEKVPLGGVDGGVELVPSPFTWLVDETEGNGALGVRAALRGRNVAQGDRVALGGGWALDEERRWYWQVDALHALPAATGPATTGAPITEAPAPAPSHAIADGRLPAGARTVTVARDNDAIYFQIVGPPPVRDGDGWLVANELGDPPFARLILPGERPSYGGQDMRVVDERWLLKRGQTYWVRIGKIRLYGPDKPVGMWARTAPIRVN